MRGDAPKCNAADTALVARGKMRIGVEPMAGDLSNFDSQGARMRGATTESWVVYSMPLKNSPTAMRAVCEQMEWEAMERAKPGYYTLVQAGIVNEGEAERLARGSSGEARPRNAKRIAPIWADEQRGAAARKDVPAES
jgi:hypothetical protein